jgi:phospholipid/cholesterol/gamma-HCH transport system permease protein
MSIIGKLGIAERVGAPVVAAAKDAGGMSMIVWRAMLSLYPLDLERDEFWRAMYKFGVKSVPIVLVTAFFAGGIMVLQAAMYVTQYGLYTFVGWAAGFLTLRELGPLLIGLMFSGRVGANNAAELATMTITEQVDALRVLAIEPFRYLVMPRLLAMVVMLFCLTAIGDLVAITGGAVIAKVLLGLELRVFFQSIIDMVPLSDLFIGLFKSALFGLTIGVVSSHYGLSVQGGAQGVGRAVNACVVGTAITLFVVDYFVTTLLI